MVTLSSRMFDERESRIQRMSFRYVVLTALSVLGVFVLGACGGSEDDEAVGDGLTAELAVAPASQVVVVATEVPTATAEPTATVEPTVAEESDDEKARVNIPNRGYNSLGDPDAPITMFDFSDFL